jgi:hypothetical protein
VNTENAVMLYIPKKGIVAGAAGAIAGFRAKS